MRPSHAAPPLLPSLAVLGAIALLGPACTEGAAGGGRPLGVTADASCERSLTAYQGDCLAPGPVDPAEGIVAHYGPADYDDPDQIARYLVPPGKEPVDCDYVDLGNAEEFAYSRYEVRSRPGTHHVILDSTAAQVPPGTHGSCDGRFEGVRLLATVQGAIDGGIFEYPPSGVIAPENAHVGTVLSPHQLIAYEVHAVNATEAPLLRESWTTFRTLPPGEVTEPAAAFAFNGGISMHVKPGTRQVITNQCVVPAPVGPVRVLDLFGHMHAHGVRVSAWSVTPDSTSPTGEARRLIYETYDWSKTDLLELSSAVKNPPVTYRGGSPGGASGPLELAAGDRIDYECEIVNTTSRELTFVARAFDGEMCNLFGSYVPGRTDPWVCLGQ